MAWHLAERGASVTVLEREAAPAMGSTGRSAAGVRVQFTIEANVRLSLYSLPVYREFRERYGHDVGYRPIGYLLLVPPERWASHLDAVRMQHRLGAPVEVLTPREALAYVPFRTEGLAGATYGPWDGVIDPHLATHAWVTMARERGVRFRFDAPVRRVRRSGSGWRVETPTGAVACGWMVNAAGAWSAEVAALAGLELPVVPKRVQIFLSEAVDDPRTYPLTIDVGSGVYLRSEGERILFGLDDPAQEPGFAEGLEPAWLEHVLRTAVRRFPWFADLGIDVRGSWWGYYAVTPDHSPVIGPHPDAEGWIDACGFSGHGIMHAPATGRAVAELICGDAPGEVDVSAFGHDRFTRDHPVEAHVF